MNDTLLYKTIFKNLEKEDKELTDLSGQGIFYAPELYVAIELGKAIKRNEKEIFNGEVEWIRETDFGNGGPTDFAFKLGNTIVAFELKLRQTVHAYKSDIEKLKRLDDTKDINYQKYFIALIDSWKKDNGGDDRIKKLKEECTDIQRIAKFEYFETKQERYAGDIVCNVGVWRID